MHKSADELLEVATDRPIRCEVTMDGEGHVSDDFICVMSRENGDASLFYNTDALTLGMAMKMVTRAFVETVSTLSEEEQAEITDILGSAFVADSPERVEVNA